METLGASGRISAVAMSPANPQKLEFGWRKEASVEEWLLAEPWQFEFFQAVKLLELLRSEPRVTGESFDPDSEIVRFRSRVTLEYPASEVQHLEPPAVRGDPFTMAVNLLGAAGQYGPLPLTDTERILERVARRDMAMRDFLDLFNHRLLSLLVKIRKATQLSFTADQPQNSRAAFYLYSFFGLGSAGLANRLRVPDRALLHYCGILAQHPRSASGLERMFSDYFRVSARVTQLVGGWRYLEEDQWTRLGFNGQNQVLGTSALVGKRYWDQQGSFEVDLGPLNFRNFYDFLPCGSAFQPLCELTRFYAGPEQEFTFRLILHRDEVPPARLQRNSRLGWTSWLRTKPFTADDSQVRLHGRQSRLK
jgi:type VI secretion system protein ImpH